MKSNIKSALVLGGSSLIGKRVVTKFRTSSPLWNVMNLDFTENPEANKNYIIPKNMSKIYNTDLRKSIDGKFDLIINANSCFSRTKLDKEDLFESLENLQNLNVSSSILASHLAKRFLNPNSLLVFIGSDEAKNSSSFDNFLFKMTKNSVHHLTDILVKNPNELPDNTKIITLLPNMIDCFMKKDALKTKKDSEITSIEKMISLIKQLADVKNYPPENFIKI